MGKIDALWVGPGGHVLADGTDLIPGETVVQISEGEAVESDNWQPAVEVVPPPSAKTPKGDK